VPGAGKTLVGLNVATRRGAREDAAHAVFLSGNEPLVAVPREALARDDLDRAKRTDPRARGSTRESTTPCRAWAWRRFSRLWINSLLDRRDAIPGAQLP